METSKRGMTAEEMIGLLACRSPAAACAGRGRNWSRCAAGFGTRSVTAFRCCCARKREFPKAWKASRPGSGASIRPERALFSSCVGAACSGRGHGSGRSRRRRRRG
jgi:hypothetical protein